MVEILHVHSSLAPSRPWVGGRERGHTSLVDLHQKLLLLGSDVMPKNNDVVGERNLVYMRWMLIWIEKGFLWTK